jgi:hypothetical protein
MMKVDVFVPELCMSDASCVDNVTIGGGVVIGINRVIIDDNGIVRDNDGVLASSLLPWVE